MDMIVLSESEYFRLNEDCGGFCLACGDEAYGVEPDARHRRCESCGEFRVFGAEELLVMGKLEIEEDC